MPPLGPGCLSENHSCLVTLELDFCNVLYMELPLKATQKFQLVQNAVAQYADVTPLLCKLH